MSETSMQDALNGFTYKGKNYPGVEAIIKDLQWAVLSDTWNISRENHINNGVVNLG
jgi:hypothetical protein